MWTLKEGANKFLRAKYFVVNTFYNNNNDIVTNTNEQETVTRWMGKSAFVDWGL